MKFKIGLGQVRLEVGVDQNTMSGNIARMRQVYEQAKSVHCDVVLFPELAVTGYSPEDILLRLDGQIAFTQACNDFRDEILHQTEGPAIIFGSPRMVSRNKDGSFPQNLESASTIELGDLALANGALVVDPKSKLSHEIYKIHLPNWGIFDEARIFSHAREVASVFEISGVKCGIAICRDIWIEKTVADLVELGARVIFVPNASPYANSRAGERNRVLKSYSEKYGVSIAYLNMIQGCDELVFDGGSCVVDDTGQLCGQTERFVEDFKAVEIEIGSEQVASKKLDSPLTGKVDLSGSLGHDIFIPQETYEAIVLGTREFINATGINWESGLHTKVCIGLSGGVDCALVATIAVDALGPSRVHGVLMPSKFTSQRSIDDAELLAKNLGITTETISIEKMHETATDEFSLDSLEGVVSENIQSRLRGLILMMVSNAKHYLVLSTGNKSEGAVGYCTLYGDTIGAWAPIKDVYKTQVYEICKWRNFSTKFEANNPIPQSIIDREPTAELRENQTDEDALYPYDILDGILELFIDHEFSFESIIERGFDPLVVERIIRLVKANEFKRSQSPVGPRLTRKNFGRGRRVPICAHW